MKLRSAKGEHLRHKWLRVLPEKMRVPPKILITTDTGVT